ncbi:Galactoside O-acetyltransferase [Lactiplantibacillus plantarum subsp. plantarum]|uniref:Galactoside O-acetyltransferase n=1 Tax=Lactiplantibacillus plantarum subsp. plantarum TaxID=337330 RepID=A0A2S3U9G8_LACPN|nr:Galactoside O-acetyltransferase [Lactiplantibacillus plantarum subsp. plantarum]
MDELEKSLSGQNYDAHAPVFLEMKRHTRELLSQYRTTLLMIKRMRKKTLLRAMFAAVRPECVGW